VANGCCHYWVINRSNARFAAGRCRHCGEERQFLNQFSRPSNGESGIVDVSIGYQMTDAEGHLQVPGEPLD
jgi:hypothetical protein